LIATRARAKGAKKIRVGSRPDPLGAVESHLPMIMLQAHCRLSEFRRGCHLITSQVLAAIPQLSQLECGVLQVFVQHTSASLTLNENADPDVRADLAMALDRIAPESWPYKHTCEGPDDMPAHVKASLLGASLLIPIAAGRPALGTWQGIYLCEHRDRGGRRSLLLTAWGLPAAENSSI